MTKDYEDNSIEMDMDSVGVGWKEVKLNTLMEVKMCKFVYYYWIVIRTNSTNPKAPKYLGLVCGDRHEILDLVKGLDKILQTMKGRLPRVYDITLPMNRNKWNEFSIKKLAKEIARIQKKLKC